MFDKLFEDLINAAWGTTAGEYHDPQRIISWSKYSLDNLNDEQLGEAATSLVRYFHSHSKMRMEMDDYLDCSSNFQNWINLMIRYKEAFEFIEKAANYLARYNEWKECY